MNLNKKKIIVGITTAYKIMPNEFREVILANSFKKKLQNQDNNSDKINLYLFNDDIDPFTNRHLKLFNKSFPNLNYEKYIGTPIYLIPSPKPNFDNLSSYFLELYLIELKSLGINFSRIYNSSKIRKTKKFQNLANKIISNQKNIINLVEKNFGLDYTHKFIKILNNNNKYELTSNLITTQNFKFPWSIECLIRWNYLHINYEFFTKNYLTKPSGSYHISSKINREILKKDSVKSINYEFLNFNPDINKIYNILPSFLFNQLLSQKNTSSNYINLDSSLKLLKQTNFQDSSSSYFDILNFLSHFDKTHLNNKTFKKSFKNHFEIKFLKINEYKQLLNLIPEFKLQFHKTENFNISNDMLNWIKNNLDLIYKIKCNSKNFNSFKASIVSLFQNFSKSDYFELNYFLYSKQKGISVQLFFFLFPIELLISWINSKLITYSQNL